MNPEIGLLALLIFGVGLLLTSGLMMFAKIERSLGRIHRRGKLLMALSDEVRATMDAVKAGIEAAVADIHALHAKVDSFLEVGDVAAARAALGEAQPALDALAAAVAIPEEPQPPIA